MLLKSAPGYIKHSPKSHKLEGITTTDHHAFVLSKYPRHYPKTSQQKKVAEVAKTCGIKKGMKRSELVTKMIDCVGPKMSK